jgi:hypothetical protein
MKSHNKITKVSKSELIYSTRFNDDSQINRSTIKQYQCNYNYETKQSFECAYERNEIIQICNGDIIEQSFIYSIQPKEVPILCSSNDSEQLFSIDDELTIKNYHTHLNPVNMHRKRQYFEYFNNHFNKD